MGIQLSYIAGDAKTHTAFGPRKGGSLGRDDEFARIPSIGEIKSSAVEDLSRHKLGWKLAVALGMGIWFALI